MIVSILLLIILVELLLIIVIVSQMQKAINESYQNGYNNGKEIAIEKEEEYFNPRPWEEIETNWKN